MDKTYTEDESLVTLANSVILKNQLTYMDSVKTRYVLVDPYISKTCHGKCIKANGELKHYGKLDFLVEFSKEVWDSIDDATREILMYHELMHILVKEVKGKEVLSIAPHDLQDFYTIIKKYGVEWFQQFKDIVAATYELEGADKDKIAI